VSKVEVDPRGWPDYTYPMTIIGQELNVAIDIAAQSLPTLDVNIAASTVTMDVNIASSAVTLNINIESISEGVTFNVAQSGTWTINAVQSGTWTINIGAPLDAEGNVETSIVKSVQLDVNIAASAVTLNVAIQSSAVTLNVNITGSDAIISVYITGQSASVDVRITSSTVTLNVNIESIASGVVFNVAQSGTWTINAVQSGDWNINIESVSAGVTFNVNITGSTATVNIDIKAQSVAIKGLTDWAAENATDIDIAGFTSLASGAEGTVVEYTVPSGYMLLIYNWDVAMRDNDGQLFCRLYNVTAGVTLGYGGGTRGFIVAYSKPIRVSSGHTIALRARQDTGVTVTICGHIGGVLL